MSNSVVLTGILLIILAGASALAFGRLIFKKSIVFKIFLALILPIDTIAVLAFFVGARGVIHLAWAAPIAIAFLFVGYYLVNNMLRTPLNEMRDKVLSLSEGNVDISINEKYLKGENEMAQVMRMLVKLTDSLQNIVRFTGHIGKGELDARYDLLGEKDTLGQSMLDMRRNLQEAEEEKEKRQAEDERRKWITLGIAKFAELLRNNNDNIDELCSSIVSNLVKYIDANQAGIFILNDDDAEHPVLEMKACYAYERHKFMNKTVETNEGLIGACFLERESIYMTAIPNDYIRITSGLGTDNPRALLIVPLKINEEMYGVIEIAAFKAFEPHVREFVEKVAESIASTIGSVKVNMQTGKLLAQSRLQTEEMANQEEELRQNMEEMQATQEEMRRREAEQSEILSQMKELRAKSEEQEIEMRQFYSSIFDSFNIVEFSPEGIITDINQNTLRSIPEIAKFDILGKPLSGLIGEETVKTVKENFDRGESFENTTLIPVDGKKEVLFKQKFIPIRNSAGELKRALLMAYEIE